MGAQTRLPHANPLEPIDCLAKHDQQVREIAPRSIDLLWSSQTAACSPLKLEGRARWHTPHAANPPSRNRNQVTDTRRLWSAR